MSSTEIRGARAGAFLLELTLMVTGAGAGALIAHSPRALSSTRVSNVSVFLYASAAVLVIAAFASARRLLGIRHEGGRAAAIAILVLVVLCYLAAVLRGTLDVAWPVVPIFLLVGGLIGLDLAVPRLIARPRWWAGPALALLVAPLAAIFDLFARAHLRSLLGGSVSIAVGATLGLVAACALLRPGARDLRSPTDALALDAIAGRVARDALTALLVTAVIAGLWAYEVVPRPTWVFGRMPRLVSFLALVFAAAIVLGAATFARIAAERDRDPRRIAPRPLIAGAALGPFVPGVLLLGLVIVERIAAGGWDRLPLGEMASAVSGIDLALLPLWAVALGALHAFERAPRAARLSAGPFVAWALGALTVLTLLALADALPTAGPAITRGLRRPLASIPALILALPWATAWALHERRIDREAASRPAAG